MLTITRNFVCPVWGHRCFIDIRPRRTVATAASRSSRLRMIAWPQDHGTMKSPTLLFLLGRVSQSSGARSDGAAGASSAGRGVGGGVVLRRVGGRGRLRGDVTGISRRRLGRRRRAGPSGVGGVGCGLSGALCRQRRVGGSTEGAPAGRGEACRQHLMLLVRRRSARPGRTGCPVGRSGPGAGFRQGRRGGRRGGAAVGLRQRRPVANNWPAEP